jgi:hypothetical protein
MIASSRTDTPILLLALWGLGALTPIHCQAHNERVHEEISASAFQSSDGLQRFLTDHLGSTDAPFLDGPRLFGHVPPLENMDGWALRTLGFWTEAIMKTCGLTILLILLLENLVFPVGCYIFIPFLRNASQGK